MYAKKSISSLLFFLFMSLIACGGGGGGSTGSGDSSSDSGANNGNDGSDNPSDNSGDDGGVALSSSHNAGQNCMNCHTEGASGGAAGIFSVAGTIYSSGSTGLANATVNLYVADTNTLILTTATDASGNFYSTEEVRELTTGIGNKGNFVDGVSVEVVGPSGQRSVMSGNPTSGACSGCHFTGTGGNGRIFSN